ncbi:MAG: hypothetical protein NTU99_04125 [Pseudanabaena sp. LacPavin_0818_WC45_MAG_42_6]|nr:hypothetical protein [Pseudanabaena sp. LacPavin_0818_WC45_MAG_42_6]
MLYKLFLCLNTYRRNRTQIDEYMFRLEQSQEQHYQEWLNKEPSEVIARLRSHREQVKKELLLTS